MYKEIENGEEDIIMHEDKILNNSFNTGETEYTPFSGVMKVDDMVYSFYEDQLSDNLTDVRIVKELNETIYEIFENSIYFEKYKIPRRVDKSDMIKMYYFFKDILKKKNIYTTSQIFIGFAEFFQINYNLLYIEVSIEDKEELLKEMHIHNGIKSLSKTKKLF